MRYGAITTAILLLAGGTTAESADKASSPEVSQLSQPVRIEAGGELIDTHIGHAAPFVGDFDGDGKKDLLVGQFGDGKLKIYRNLGTNEEPRFEDFTWFQAGGKLGKVPGG